MSLELTETTEGRILEVHVTGKLDQETYKRFVPITEARIQAYGKIRILLVLHNFHGWNAGALWEDIKFDLKHFNEIERLAIVGETKWQKGMAVFCRPFTTARIKYFDHSELDAAREWIHSDT
ncbi:MAG: STAS/SEC14 domain-containing protein [Pirellulales bacterium]